MLPAVPKTAKRVTAATFSQKEIELRIHARVLAMIDPWIVSAHATM